MPEIRKRTITMNRMEASIVRRVTGRSMAHLRGARGAGAWARAAAGPDEPEFRAGPDFARTPRIRRKAARARGWPTHPGGGPSFSRTGGGVMNQVHAAEDLRTVSETSTDLLRELVSHLRANRA